MFTGDRDHQARIGHDCCLATAYRLRGLAFLVRGQSSDALADFAAAQKLRPDDAQLHDDKARAYSLTNDLKQALTESDQAVAAAPHEPRYRLTRVILYLRTNDSKDAIADLTTVLAMPGPPATQAPTYALRGYAYQLSRQTDAAMADYEKALKLSPDQQMALVGQASIDGSAGEYERALSNYNRVLKVAPKEPSALLGRGALRSRLGKYQQALDDINAAIEIAPSYPPSYLEQGLALVALGKQDQGIASMKHAIQMDPDKLNYHAYLSNAYAITGDLELAMTEAKTAAGGDDPLTGYLSLSSLGILTGNDGLAIDNARAAVKLAPSPATYEYLINAQREAGDYQTALETANMALKSEPENANLLSERGITYALSHRADIASDDLNKAARLDRHAARYLCIGFALISDEKLAQTSCEDALATAPADFNALVGRAYLKLTMQDWTDARNDYDKAAQLMKNSAAVLFARGYTKERLGDIDGATEDYTAAKQVNPKIAERYARIGIVPGKDTVEPPAH